MREKRTLPVEREATLLALTLLGVALYTLCLAVLGGLIGATIQSHHSAHRGVAYGLPTDAPLTTWRRTTTRGWSVV
jgi:hypothetical protein